MNNDALQKQTDQMTMSTIMLTRRHHQAGDIYHTPKGEPFLCGKFIRDHFGFDAPTITITITSYPHPDRGRYVMADTRDSRDIYDSHEDVLYDNYFEQLIECQPDSTQSFDITAKVA